MVTHPGIDDATERDIARVKAELRDRLDRADAFDCEAAVRWLAAEHPDLVNEALDEIGAPA